jgi:hypothetical protein
MLILLKLILAHLLGDFLLQPSTWVAEKEIRTYKSIKLYLHSLIHGVLVYLLLWNWLIALIVTVSHFIIDLVKLLIQRESNRTKWFVLDQLAHVCVLLLIWIAHENVSLDFHALFVSEPFWLMVTSLVFLTFGVAIIMNVLLESWSGSIDEQPGISLANAGKVIGILERLLVFVFILTDHWEGVGFLIAAKSVFRFGDLKESKDRKLTEYILIGTLVSFGLAILTALATQFYLNRIS